MSLQVEGLVVRFGTLAALAGIDLQVGPGERLSVLGPSGSGKSTLLRTIAGLELPSAGNVAFGLRLRGDPPGEQRRRVAEVLALVGLAGYERRDVARLSGGEQQRVALARALAPQPELLMLDEPLGALDRDLRQRLLAELSELFANLGLTIIYVTHDQAEALAVGDRVAVMRAGRLEAVLPPDRLWRAPPTEFVARFLGFNNLLPVELDGTGRVDSTWGSFEFGAANAQRSAGDRGSPPASRTRTLLVRPEGIRPQPNGRLAGRVTARTFRGERVLLRLELEQAPPLEMLVDWAEAPQLGETVRLSIDPHAVELLPAPPRPGGPAADGTGSGA